MGNINQLKDSDNNILYDIRDIDAIRTSAITNTTSSQSTDSEIPSAKYIYDELVLVAQILSELFESEITYDLDREAFIKDGTAIPISDILELDVNLEDDSIDYKINLDIE